MSCVPACGRVEYLGRPRYSKVTSFSWGGAGAIHKQEPCCRERYQTVQDRRAEQEKRRSKNKPAQERDTRRAGGQESKTNEASQSLDQSFTTGQLRLDPKYKTCLAETDRDQTLTLIDHTVAQPRP